MKIDSMKSFPFQVRKNMINSSEIIRIDSIGHISINYGNRKKQESCP